MKRYTILDAPSIPRLLQLKSETSCCIKIGRADRSAGRCLVNDTAATIFTSSFLTTKGNLDVFDRVYYMRAIVGIVAGVIAGVVIPPEYDQNTSVGIAILIAVVSYFVSFGISKNMAKNVPKDKRRKVATDGIIPFIFLLLTFMIIVYTALHQSMLIK